MASLSNLQIILIDDHALLRAGLRLVLQSALPDASIREAGSMNEATAGNTVEPPDLVLLDIEMPGLSGLEGLTWFKRHWPRTPVVMLTSHTEAESRSAALARGAAAFLVKSDSAEKMLAVIRTAVQGEAAPEMSSVGEDDGTPHLTVRQCEVLDQMSRGFPNKVIGRHLNLSENTVRGHVQAVLIALGASSRAEAVFAARQRGLVR